MDKCVLKDLLYKIKMQCVMFTGSICLFSSSTGRKVLGDSDNSSFFSCNAWLHHSLMSCFFHACSLGKFCCLQQYVREALWLTATNSFTLS